MTQAEELKGILGLLDLPDDVILQILGYLQVLDLVLGVRRTCKRLHELSQSSCLWRDLTFSYDALRYGYEHDAYLTYYNGLLNQKCLVPQYRDCERDGGDGKDTVPGKGDCTQWKVEEDSVQNRVISLTLKVTESCTDKTPVNSHFIFTQLLVCPRLQRLKLKVHSLPNTVFLNQHQGLRSLTIDTVHSKGCAESVNNIFTHLQSFINLRTLQLQIGEWEEPLDRVKTMWVAMKDYFQTGPALTCLRLDIPVNDDVFTTILDSCEELEDLQLTNGHLTRRVFKKMLKSPNICLTALRLKGCPLTDPSMVYAIAQSFRHIKQLELSIHVPSADISLWFQANDALLSRSIFPDMTVLKVEVQERLSNIQQSIQQENVNGADEPLPKVKCPAVPTEEEGRLEELDYVFDEFLNLWVNLPRLCFQPHLRSVGVTLANYHPYFPVLKQTKDDNYISDDELQGLIMSCQQLQHVDLRGCWMRPTGVAFLRTLPHLETLRCSLCANGYKELDRPANGDAVTENSLRHLDLHMVFVPSSQLRTLCSYFPGLTSLTIVMNGYFVKTSHMEMILSSLPRLNDLNLKFGTHFTRRGIGNDPTYSVLVRLLASGRQLRTVTWQILDPVRRAQTRTLARAVVSHPTLSRLFLYDTLLLDTDDLKHCLAKEVRLQNDRPSRLITARHKFSDTDCDNVRSIAAPVCISVYRRRRDASVRHRVVADPPHDFFVGR